MHPPICPPAVSGCSGGDPGDSWMCGGRCGMSGDGCTQPSGRSLVSVGESARLTSHKSAASAFQPPDSGQPRNGKRNHDRKRCVPAHAERVQEHRLQSKRQYEKSRHPQRGSRKRHRDPEVNHSVFCERSERRTRSNSMPSLILWARCHAVFCVTPKSRCSFMLPVPFKPVVSR